MYQCANKHYLPGSKYKVKVKYYLFVQKLVVTHHIKREACSNDEIKLLWSVSMTMLKTWSSLKTIYCLQMRFIQISLTLGHELTELREHFDHLRIPQCMEMGG